MSSRLFLRAKVAALRAAAPLLEPIYSGMASILALHRVREVPPFERVGFPRWIECTPRELERTIALFRTRGYTFVSSDELCERLGKRNHRSNSKLAVVTLDDGYVDNYRVAAPLFASYGIPYTLYLASGFPDRTVAPWAHLLEETLAARTHFRITYDGESHTFPLRSPAERSRACEAVASLFSAAHFERTRSLAEELFGVEATRRAMDDHYLTWDMLRSMIASGRATIGAHTVDHVPLPSLSLEQARQQMAASKERIETMLGIGVRHCAYPFGACGPREAELARELGFVSAVTTRVANIFPEHAHHLHALPRVYTVFASLAASKDAPLFRDELALQLSGASPALANRGRRVVTLDQRTA